MAGSASADDEEAITAINVTPLVDICLVLLIIFIATSAIIVRAEIGVQLPRAATAEDSTTTAVSIQIDQSGQVSLNGEPTTLEFLRPALEAEVGRNPQVKAMIAADSALQYGTVVGVIDVVRLSGITSFALNVERGEQPAGY